jgi:hypothetical protein
VFAKACELGLEGIVSKRAGSRYSSGNSRQWLKSKNPAFHRLDRAFGWGCHYYIERHRGAAAGNVGYFSTLENHIDLRRLPGGAEGIRTSDLRGPLTPEPNAIAIARLGEDEAIMPAVRAASWRAPAPIAPAASGTTF